MGSGNDFRLVPLHPYTDQVQASSPGKHQDSTARVFGSGLWALAL